MREPVTRSGDLSIIQSTFTAVRPESQRCIATASFGRYDGWDFHANALTWRGVGGAMPAVAYRRKFCVIRTSPFKEFAWPRLKTICVRCPA
jgi:hypothetical protein